MMFSWLMGSLLQRIEFPESKDLAFSVFYFQCLKQCQCIVGFVEWLFWANGGELYRIVWKQYTIILKTKDSFATSFLTSRNPISHFSELVLESFKI